MKHKILFNILITSIMLGFIFFPTQVHAFTAVWDASAGEQISGLGSNPTSGSLITDPLKNQDFYKPNPQNENGNRLYKMGKKVLAIINIAGVVVSVIALCIIGLRYIIGSTEEKAKYKEILIPYIIGIFILGGGTTIVNIIYNLLTA